MKWIQGAAFAALFGLAGFLASCLWMTFPYIIIEVKEQNFQCKITQKTFQLSWIHSVEKTAWKERYIQDKNDLILAATQFVSFGAGTPDQGTLTRQKDGSIHMQINRKMKELNWVISRRMQGKIEIADRVWNIYQDFPDYSTVHISIKKDSLWKKRGLNDCL
ncbi:MULTISPECIES: DUF1850 domain-containing protein [Acinetobacter]|uniref:DUF1850 domain-containing protein n=1 Tax=Acinetobacter pecorum TaxID=2762215 RepID=A0ABR8VUJ4_9GAMM|nr:MULTISPECIES: DUF1850 domain-containing protein [Acinetobacter]MBD8008440.1 DUF1850 domain-containing protein [Acinetobacter pecorum]OAL78197.1 hypothetical protein AY607_06905 [Acinetobacter sp. SFA]